MDELADKRVFAERVGSSRLLAATSPGLVAVAIADDRVGEFGLVRRCAPTDLAAGADAGDRVRLAVATDGDVLLADEPDLQALAPSDHGPATAVTFDGDVIVGASPDGRLAVNHGERWEPVADLPAPPTALDGDLVGTADGVYRLVDGTLQPAGLADVTDVARAAGVPLAATADGLYALGNGWMDVLAGDVRLVAGAPDGRAHAATADGFFERTDGRWEAVELPGDASVVAVAHGEGTYAFTASGDLLVETGGGWSSHPLGLDDVRAAVVY